MNSVRRRACQTFWLGLAALAWPSVSPGEPAALPPPPPWQAELNAARTVQASLALVPAKDETEEAAREARLAEIYRQLAAKYPDAAPVQQAAGDAMAELKQPAALLYLQRAQTLDPENAETADSLGSVYLALGRVKEAAGQFQRAVDARPNVAGYQFALANVQYLFRHELLAPPALPDDQAVLRSALAHFRRAALLSPGDLRLAKAYAETFYVFAQPDWTEALAAWQTVLALSADQPDFANGHLARISLHLGRRQEAEAYLAKIHDPAFEPMKKSLLRQAGRVDKSAPVAAPPGSPAP